MLMLRAAFLLFLLFFCHYILVYRVLLIPPNGFRFVKGVIIRAKVLVAGESSSGRSWY